MRVVKHRDLQVYMLSLDHTEGASVDIVVNYLDEYVYVGCITYIANMLCWRCRPKQKSGGQIYYDTREVHAYRECGTSELYEYVVGDMSIGYTTADTQQQQQETRTYVWDSTGTDYTIRYTT